MTVQQLILINSDKVRRDSSLMAFYIECFIDAFGYKPTCTGCTFSTDWNKLVRFINKGETTNTTQNKKTISTFKLKKTTNTIYAYKIGTKVYRKYDNKFDENFVVGFLTNGTEAEIEARKKLFSVLPNILDVKVISDEEAAETLRIDLEANSEVVEIENTDVTEVVAKPKIKRARISKNKK